MQTEKLYYNYTSAAPFQAKVTELRPADGNKTFVLLDKTIFYPEGGGQPADRGTINGVHILNVLEKDGEILHLISAADAGKLKPGLAELVLDYRRRKDHTQLHTGQHLLSANILRMTGGQTVSMHIGDETCTIDVNIAEMSEETLLAIEDAVADAIEENHPVIIHQCPPEDISVFPLRKPPPKSEEVLRVVEIEGHDFSACCGTHLKSTAEIGLFRILAAERYKGMTRISFLAGRHLLLDCRRLRQNAVIISRALSVPVADIGKGTLEFMEKSALAEKRLKYFEEKAVQEKAEVLIKKAHNVGMKNMADPVIVVKSYDEENINEVINIGKTAQKQCEAVFILTSEQSLKFAAFSSVKDFDVRPFIKDAFEAQGGKGGGGNSFFQGSFGSKEALGAFIGSFVHLIYRK